MTTISLIATVLNEGDNIQRLMQTLQRQTRQPDEIIIVDGGSTDDTVAILNRYSDQLPLRVLVEPGCNISQGRNVALRAAQGDIIAITDAGVRLVDDWLEKLTQPLLDDPTCSVSCGFFVADPHTVFEAALGATTLPLVDEINPATFLPSSRSVAVRRAAALQVGGYPEWLDFCEDLIFDLRLKQTQPPFGFAPQAIAYFRSRPTLSAYFKQYYRYARGDGKADLWRKRHAIRYITYLVALPALLILALVVHPVFWLALLMGGGMYLRQPYRRLPAVMKTLPTTPTVSAWLYAALLIPVQRIVGDAAKMIGYPVGWVWRWQNNPPDWKQV
jgi:glycosyltransferase involved in cell wall biosynthesis